MLGSGCKTLAISSASRKLFFIRLCAYCLLIRTKFLSALSEIHWYHRIIEWFELAGDLGDHLVPTHPCHGGMCPRDPLLVCLCFPPLTRTPRPSPPATGGFWEVPTFIFYFTSCITLLKFHGLLFIPHSALLRCSSGFHLRCMFCNHEIRI